LNDERHGLGQGKSDVVLIIPYTSSLSNSDKDYCLEVIRQMREKVPGKLFSKTIKVSQSYYIYLAIQQFYSFA